MKFKLFGQAALALTLLITSSTPCFAKNSNLNVPPITNDEFIHSVKIPNNVLNFTKGKFEMLIQSAKQKPLLYGLQPNETNKLYLGQGFSVFDLNTKKPSSVYFFPVLSNNKIKEILTVGLNNNGKFSATLGKDFSDKLENIASKSSKSNPLTIWAYNGLLIAKNANEKIDLNYVNIPDNKINYNKVDSLLKQTNLSSKDIESIDVKNSLQITTHKILSYKEKDLYNDDDDTPTDYFLDVPIVTQRTSDGVQHGMCWAASVASIANYMENDSLTAVDVCNRMNVKYDDGANGDTAAAALNDYGVSATAVNNPLTFEQVYNSINNNKPVYMRSQGTPGHHATVINGWIASSEGVALTIMDPAYECYKEVYDDTGNGFYYYFGDDIMTWYATVELN